MTTQSVSGANSNTATRFRCGLDLVRYPLGDGRELVYAPQSQESRILPAQEVQLLQGLQSFATLAEHADATCKRLGLAPHRVPEITQQLQILAERHMLIDEAVLKQALFSGEERKPRRISTLGINASNRPALLDRCIRSYAETSRTLDRQVRFVVADNGDEACQRQTQALLENAGRDLGVDIYYAGHQDRELYANELTQRAQVPLNLVRFALLSEDSFASDATCRNALLLNCVGQLAVQVEVDTVCSLAPAPQKMAGLNLTSEYTPTRFWSGAEVWSQKGQVQPDFYSAHETLLGKSFTESSQSFPEMLSLEAIKFSFLKHLDRDASTISITSLGVSGDSGLSQTELLLRLDGATRASLLDCNDIFTDAAGSRRLIEGVAQATISNEAFATGFNIGMDNAQNLPPFVPVNSNQQKCFASLLKCNAQACYFGFLPWSIAHNSVNQWADCSINAGDIIFALLRSFQPMAGCDAERSYNRLGQYLIDWGSAPLKDFEQEIKRIVWIQASTKLDRFEWLLQKHGGQPAFWADAVRKQGNSLKARVSEANYIVPSDLSASVGVDTARTMIKNLVLALGQLLLNWSQLRAAALELQNSGFHLGRKLPK